MAFRRRKPGTTRSRRVPVGDYRPGAYVYAPFEDHVKAGIASLLPFGIMFFTFQDPAKGLILLSTGGLIITPLLLVGYAALWAVMSRGVQHALRFNTSVWTHLGAYAAAGAAALFVAAMAVLALVQESSYDGAPLTDNPRFFTLAWSTPLLGALGSMVGLWILRRYIGWYVTVEGGQLPDVLKFEDKKRARDEWEQL